MTPIVLFGMVSEVSGGCTAVNTTSPVVWHHQRFLVTLQQTHTHPVAWDGFDCTTAKQTPLVLSGIAVRCFELLYNSKASKYHSCCLGWLSDVSK